MATVWARGWNTVAMSVLVVESHEIFRSGLCACLAEHDSIGSVRAASAIREAWAGSAMRDVDLVVVDLALPGSLEFIRQLRDSTPARTIACATECSEAEVVSTVAAGAISVLDRRTLSREALSAAVRAAATGAAYLDSSPLAALMGGVSRTSRELESPVLPVTRLSDREQQVLSLIAEGHPIHEVARRLRYSERTIKSVIHDIVTKLCVRSRSQAVALAVREGLI